MANATDSLPLSRSNRNKLVKLDLLFNFHPQIDKSLKEHGGLKIYISSIGLYRKSVDPKDNEGKLSIALGLIKDYYNKVPHDELHLAHLVEALLTYPR